MTIEFWRLWALVGLRTMDVPTMALSPPMADSILDPGKMIGWWVVMGFEVMYEGWPEA